MTRRYLLIRSAVRTTVLLLALAVTVALLLLVAVTGQAHRCHALLDQGDRIDASYYGCEGTR